MRHFIVVLALIPAAIVVGYVLLSPAYLGDYRWLIIALPISLATARELFDLAKGQKTESTRHLVHVTLTPIEEDDPAGDEAGDADFESIVGLWTGTVNIWPGKPEEVLRVLPLHLAITEEGRKAAVIPAETRSDDARIVEARVIEYEPRTGYLDGVLAIEEHGERREIETRLTFARNRIAPSDDTDDVTVDLRRAHPTAVAI